MDLLQLLDAFQHFSLGDQVSHGSLFLALPSPSPESQIAITSGSPQRERIEIYRPNPFWLFGIRELRDGEINGSRFGSRTRGGGADADRIRQMFRIFAALEGLCIDSFALSTARFANPDDRQLRLF